MLKEIKRIAEENSVRSIVQRGRYFESYYYGTKAIFNNPQVTCEGKWLKIRLSLADRANIILLKSFGTRSSEDWNYRIQRHFSTSSMIVEDIYRISWLYMRS